MLKKIFITVNAIFVCSCFCQTNHIDNFDEYIKQVEGIYILKLANNFKYEVKLGGRITFETDQFGSTKRIIPQTAIKTEF